MKTVVDSRLREQARRFELRFACDDCVHFQVSEGPSSSSSGSSGCSLAYPAAPRRSALESRSPFVSSPSPASAEEDTVGAIEFCKSFELA